MHRADFLKSLGLAVVSPALVGERLLMSATPRLGRIHRLDPIEVVPGGIGDLATSPAFAASGRDVAALREEHDDEIEAAWVIIANVSGGQWSHQSPEWRLVAGRWRDRAMSGVAARAALRAR